MDFLTAESDIQPLPQRQVRKLRKRRRHVGQRVEEACADPTPSVTESGKGTAVDARETAAESTSLQNRGLLQEVEGDICKCDAHYIAHQTNCVTKHAKGLAKTIFTKFPWADTYSQNSPCRKVGTVSIHGDVSKGERMVVNIYGQHGVGKGKRGKSKHSATRTSDIQSMRENYFRSALRDFEEKVRDCRSVAFPYGIGCGLAGGVWSHYEQMLREFAARNPSTKVFLLRFRGSKNSVAKRDIKTKARGKGKPAQKEDKSSPAAMAKKHVNVSEKLANGREVSRDALQIDGSHGEGGGQIMRISLALAVIQRRSIRVHNIRAGRKTPGLRNQHVCCIDTVGKLLGSGSVDGSYSVGTTMFSLSFPEHIQATESAFSVNTRSAGSVTLLAQACLPVMIHRAITAKLSMEILLIGGTDVPFSPPCDHLLHVLLPFLNRHILQGVEVAADIRKRGFYPRGGGEVVLSVKPLNSTTPCLRDFTLTRQGVIIKLAAYLTTTGIPQEDAERGAVKLRSRMEMFSKRFCSGNTEIQIETLVLGVPSSRKRRKSQPRQICLQLVAETTTGCFLSGNGLQTLPKGKKGGISEIAEIFESSFQKAFGSAFDYLENTVTSGCCVDEHTLDQILIYMAMARRGSSVLTVPSKLSQHAATARKTIECFMGSNVFRCGLVSPISPPLQLMQVETAV